MIGIFWIRQLIEIIEIVSTFRYYVVTKHTQQKKEETMEVSTIVKKVEQAFQIVPERDARALIGPKEFLVNFIFSFFQDRGTKSLASIRRSMSALTGRPISPSSFWERLSTNRLKNLLSKVVSSLLVSMGTTIGIGNEILNTLGVTGILLLDSSSSSLPARAKKDFPAPRNNVAPAAIKLHLLFNLFGGIDWFDLSEAKMHDRKGFPPLSLLKNKLILFDLGYFDFQLFKDIQEIGGFFLTRIKENTSVIIGEVIEGLPKKFEGYPLLNIRLPKVKSKIIEVMGILEKNYKPFLSVRVVGFWNPMEKRYHWYVTNLIVSAKLIYPLYRLRWQVELIFKSIKSSLRWKDLSSSNKNIIYSLTLAAIAGSMIAHPIGRSLILEKMENKKYANTVQRNIIVLVNVAKVLSKYILQPIKNNFLELMKLLEMFLKEFIEPNANKRETSLMRVARMAGSLSGSHS